MSAEQVLAASGISLKVLDDGKLHISVNISEGKFAAILSPEYFQDLYIQSKEKTIEYKALQFKEDYEKLEPEWKNKL